jgi:hypothetical protein
MSDLIPSSPTPGGEFLFYQTEDGRTRLQVRVQDETVWLSLNQMAELFQRDKSVISRHINNVFDEEELRREATVAKSATVQLKYVPALRACLKTPERGCVVLDQPQQVPKFRRTGLILPCCGWSATQPRSFFRRDLSGMKKKS